MAKKPEPSTSNLNLEAELQNNSKFRSFQSDVIANLQTFDKAKEWADLINCIQKLQKTFSKYPQFPVIPSKLTFCKRMAQCLNPALPGGVHLRALQTFQSAFERIGPERLAADIAICSMGIFPLFQFAAINVKPVILDIFETHFIPLGPSLIPALSGVIISLLPGLEEESSEFYDRVGKILDLCCRKTNPTIFFRAMWKSIVSTPHIRAPALNYLNSRIPSQKTPETIAMYLPEVQTLVTRALSAGVSDSNLLTQRSCMELIINHFKIEENIIENWENLAVKVLYLLNRKEIALNRRLYQWFLGSSNEVFERNGKKVIVSALKFLFTTPPITIQKASDPFKIMTSLLDKQELGENIIDNVLPYIYYSLFKFKEGFPFSRELKQNANKFLEILQPGIIWNAAIALWYDRIREPEGEIIGVIDTLIDLQKCDQETQTQHLPNMLSTMISALDIIAEEGNFKKLQSCLQLARKVFGKLSALATKSSENLRELTKVISSYQNAYTNLARKYLLPYLEGNDGHFSGIVNNNTEDTEQRTLVLIIATQLLSSLLVHLPSGVVFDINDDKENSSERIPDWLETLQICCQLNHPIASTCALKTVVDLLTQPNLALNTQAQQYIIHQTHYSQQIILRLWDYLHPSTSNLHYTAAKSLLQLLDYSNKFISEILGKELLHKEPIKRVESCRKFSILWTLICDLTGNYNINPLSRNAFLMLDCLTDDQPMVKHAGSSWLVSSIPKSIERILEPLLEVLLDSSIERQNFGYRNPYDTRRLLYVLHLLKDIVECDPKLFLLHSIDRQVGKKMLMLNEIQEEFHLKSTPSYSILLDPTYYLELIIVTLTRFIQTYAGESHNLEFQEENKVVQSTATALLRSILVQLADHSQASSNNNQINLSPSQVSSPAIQNMFLRDICHKLQNPILQTLYVAVEKFDVVLQVQLLRLLQSMIIFQHKPDLSSESFSLESTSTTNIKAKRSSAVLSSHSSSTAVWDSPIFLQAVRKGLSQPDPSSILPYWLEFLTSTLGYSTDSYAKTIPSLLIFFCDCLNHFQNVYTTEISNNVMILLKSLKIVLASCLDRDEKELQALNLQSSSSSSTALSSTIEMPGKVLSSIFNVFSSEDGSAIPTSPIIEARGEILKSLPFILHSLLNIWTPPSLTPQSYIGTIDDNSSNNKYFLQDQVIQIVDYIVKSYPNEVIYAIAVIWQDRKPLNINNNNGIAVNVEDISKSIMELLNSLDSISPSVAFKSVATLISNIIKRKNIKDPKQSEALLIHETTLLDFVNRFILESRVAASELTKTWADLVILLRESMTSRSPAALLLLFRILNNFVAKSIPLEEKKQRKEQQDITVKLIELCLKACDSSIAKGLPEDSKDRERIEALSLKATQLLSTMVPSMFDKVFDDKERAVTLMPSVLANIKDHSEKRLPWAYSAVVYLSNLQKNGCGLTAWKKEVLNHFYDNSFFLFDFKAISEWKKIIIDIAKNDKTFFSDLLARVSKSLTSQPSMMFVSKEQENLMRSRNIKRIAFVLYAGELDQWSTSLTVIQEILVDALKLPNALTVYEQVFLCLRVMLIRMSHKRLTSFWPVILAEMMRIFGFGGKVALNDQNLVLAATKFIDFALIVPSEQFRLYEWIFIKDFPDSISISPSQPSVNQNDPNCDILRNSPLPYHTPFIDQLSTKSVSDYPIKLNNGGAKESPRQPLILLRSVDNIEQLYSYLRYYSKMAYESSLTKSEKYSDVVIDRAVEADLIEYSTQLEKEFEGTPEKLIHQLAQLDLLHSETKPQFDTLDKLDTETTNEENQLEVNINIDSSPNLSQNNNNNVSNNNLSNNIIIDNYNDNSNDPLNFGSFPSVNPSDFNAQFFSNN